MSESTVQGVVEPKAGAARLLSDARLTRRAAEGDRRAFAAIFNRYHQDLYRYCVAILGSSHDAQDALQNTMVKVLAALPGEKREIQLKPWLYRIAHNEAVDLHRTRRPVESLNPDVAITAAGPVETAELRARMQGLFADIEELPERQRGALVMRELSDLSFEQIGAAFGTSPAVARQTVYEARLSLQRMSEGREMDCAAVTKALSDGDGRLSRRRELRAHLRSCAACRQFEDGLEQRQRDFAVIAPMPALIATGLLHGIVGGSASSASGGMLAGVGAVTGKTVAGSALVKSAATVAVVAAVGVGAADRGGVVDVLPGGSSDGGSSMQQAAPSGSEGAGGQGASMAPTGPSPAAKGGQSGQAAQIGAGAAVTKSRKAEANNGKPAAAKNGMGGPPPKPEKQSAAKEAHGAPAAKPNHGREGAGPQGATPAPKQPSGSPSKGQGGGSSQARGKSSPNSQGAAQSHTPGPQLNGAGSPGAQRPPQHSSSNAAPSKPPTAKSSKPQQTGGGKPNGSSPRPQNTKAKPHRPATRPAGKQAQAG